jgi:hypothetical protein|tara:strand:+ start:14167 stop:14868 length:702 start_codon:yes stop_codon:yes gene_type:complete
MKYIILLSGKMRSGKNQICDYLVENFKEKDKVVETDFFAKDLKNNCKDDFMLLTSVLNSYADGLKSVINNFYDVMIKNSYLENINDEIDKIKVKEENFFEDKTIITRALLQIYGTNIFRDRVDTNYWANQVKNRALDSEADVIIITDTRFPNELDVFSGVNMDEISVISIRMDRDTGIVDSHPSETALDNHLEWSYIVDNTGTLEDLKDSANSIVEHLLENKDSVPFSDFLKK